MSLKFLEHELQYIALSIMGIVYISKIIWILKFRPMKERTPSKGNKKQAITTSFFCIAMPWTMESSRRKWYKWLEFAIFHIGITVAILASFLIPEFPYLMTPTIITLFQVIIAASFLILLIRLGRRLFSTVNRLISHPDDYFSLVMMILWFFFAFFAMPMDKANWMYAAYFALTAFLIGYVPFSKMSHYILWPFTRYYFGKHFGHRGVYPKANKV
jgi:nitrate reductase gamma subunit